MNPLPVASFFRHKKSTYYYLKVKRGGKWKQEPTVIRFDEPGSLRKIRRLVAEEQAKELSGPSKCSGWSWVPGWLNQKYRDKTLLRYAAAWTAIEVYLETHKASGPEAVSYTTCTQYPDWRTKVDRTIMKPCKWNTALTELKVFSSVMQEAVRRGMISANPCLRLGFRRRDVKKKPEITEQQQRQIEFALRNLPEDKHWMRDSWIIAMSQGFRLSATSVPVENIDLTLNVVSVVSKGKIHTAPLHENVRNLAEIAIAEGRTRLVDFPPSPAKEWWKFFRRLGLEISFHSTRVTVATRLARNGFSKQQTMAYVGHASETVHDVYTRLSAPDVGHLGKVLNNSLSDASQKE